MKLGTRFAALAAAACLTLGLAACGGDDDGGGSDVDQVRELAQQVLDNDSAVCDSATDKFIDRVGGSKEDCEKTSEEGEKVDSEVKGVEIDGDKASATIEGDRDATINFVKEDGDWKVDTIEQSTASDDDTETETEAETTTSESTASSAEREPLARAAGDAYLAAVKENDEAVICGLLDEEYAKELTGASEYGIAECVDELKGKDFNVTGSVKTDEVNLDDDLETGEVTLTNGKSISVKWDGERYVITQLNT